MSKSETLGGTITIPARDVSALCKALSEVANTTHDAVYEKARELHRGIKTTSLDKYAKAIQDLSFRNADLREGSHAYLVGRDNIHFELATDVLRSIHYSGKLHLPTRADVERHAPKATNRTAEWACHGPYGGQDGVISIKGRALSIDADGNHAATHTLESPMGRTLLKALNAIAWGRNSGGAFWYNSEANEGPSGNSWGGGDTITEHFGPLGKAAYKSAHGWYPGE